MYENINFALSSTTEIFAIKVLRPALIPNRGTGVQELLRKTNKQKVRPSNIFIFLQFLAVMKR